ncbi:MAG: diacylglycerol kinase [Betaproteobacteria bacterium]|nr:diacylglycerol kinase [Betaproteobacteria bacterium]
MKNQEKAGQAATGAEAHPDKGKDGLIRLRNAVRYSCDGLKAAYRHEQAFRQETWLALLMIPCACVLPVPLPHRALLIGSVLLVLIAELINSALEAVVDRISHERHELSKRAKDAGSAAVFLALINALVVWGCILFPLLSDLIF